MTSPPSYTATVVDDRTYCVTVPSAEGRTELTLLVTDVPGLSAQADGIVAATTAAFLLEHQQAQDLPPMIELEDVIAAYPTFVPELQRRLSG